MILPEPPRIPALESAADRPLFSVMIPVYEPGPYLLETLASILSQDLGTDAMQIAVLDDASPRVDVNSLIASSPWAKRVTVFRNERNLGLAGNWNEGIRQARGRYVHLLHQDDLVSPGFYARINSGFDASSDVGMAFTRYRFIDAQGAETKRSDLERRKAGIVNNWLLRITERYRVHCPAAVVRRSVYESLGGFRSDLSYALDWEMWVRIAARYSVWFEPEPLASYRQHPDNASARLESQKATHTDELHAMEIFANHIAARSRASLMNRAYARFARSRLRRVRKRIDDDSLESAAYQLSCGRIAIERLPRGLRRSLYLSRAARLQNALAAKSGTLQEPPPYPSPAKRGRE